MPDPDTYGLLKWWNERMGTWTTDSEGNQVLRGLTKTETDELNEIREGDLRTSGGEPRWQSGRETTAQASRRKVLLDKHNRARLDYEMSNMIVRRERSS